MSQESSDSSTGRLETPRTSALEETPEITNPGIWSLTEASKPQPPLYNANFSLFEMASGEMGLYLLSGSQTRW